MSWPAWELDDAGFQAAAVHAECLAAPAWPADRSRLLTESLVSQVPHDARWRDQIAQLL
jgi:hypothetical protein